MKKISRIILFTLLILLFPLVLFVSGIEAKSGCCSWHDGVSHCSGGRIVCNDGTYSPSCTCPEDNYDYYGNYDGSPDRYDNDYYDNYEPSVSSDWDWFTILSVGVSLVILVFFGRLSAGK